MELLHNKYNSLPEQVEQNRQNINIIAGEIEEMESPEGADIKSTEVPDGKVLTSDGEGGAEWTDPPVPHIDVEGRDIKSTNISSGKVLTSDGNGGAAWSNVLFVIDLNSSSGTLTDAQYNQALENNTIIRYNVGAGIKWYFYKSNETSTSSPTYVHEFSIDDDNNNIVITKHRITISANKQYTKTEFVRTVPKSDIITPVSISGENVISIEDMSQVFTERISYADNGTVTQATKSNGICHLVYLASYKAGAVSATSNWLCLGKLASTHKPSLRTAISAISIGGTTPIAMWGFIDTNGLVFLWMDTVAANSTTRFDINCWYPCN